MSGCSYCGNSMASWRKRGIEVDTSDPNIYSFCKENKYRLVPRDYPIGTKHGSISLDPGYIASFRQQFHALFDAHGVYRPDDRTRRVHGKNHRRNSHIPKPENWRRGWDSNPRMEVLQTSVNSYDARIDTGIVAIDRGLQNLHSWVRIPPAPPIFWLWNV